MKTWNSQLQSCNILVYWFFLQSIICIALLFYIEHYLVAIHYSSIYIYIPHGFLKRSILKVCETISKSQHRRFQSKSRRYWKFKIVVFSMFDIWELQQKNDSLVCTYIHIYIYIYIYGIHHWRIFRSSYRKLAWVGFQPKITEFRYIYNMQ